MHPKNSPQFPSSARLKFKIERNISDRDLSTLETSKSKDRTTRNNLPLYRAMHCHWNYHGRIKIAWLPGLLLFDGEMQRVAATIISYQRFNQAGVDAIDAYAALRPRPPAARRQLPSYAWAHDRIAPPLSVFKHATKPTSVRSPAELQANNDPRGN